MSWGTVSSTLTCDGDIGGSPGDCCRYRDGSGLRKQQTSTPMLLPDEDATSLTLAGSVIMSAPCSPCSRHGVDCETS